MTESLQLTEAYITPEADSTPAIQAKLMEFMSLPWEERKSNTETGRILNDSLAAFAGMNRKQRESFIPTLQSFVMQESKDEEGNVIDVIIDTDLVANLATETETSEKLQKAAEYVTTEMNFTTAGTDAERITDGIKLYEGNFEVVKLDPETGEIQAHAVTKEFDGFDDYQIKEWSTWTSFKSLARHALRKAIFGLHLLKAKQEDPSWPSTNLKDSIGYFKELGVEGTIFLGNADTIGCSGVDMTLEARQHLFPGMINLELLPDQNYIIAGAADQTAARAIKSTLNLIEQGKTLAKFYHTSELDTSVSH